MKMQIFPNPNLDAVRAAVSKPVNPSAETAPVIQLGIASVTVEEKNAFQAYRLGQISFMQMLECMRTNSPPKVVKEKGKP